MRRAPKDLDLQVKGAVVGVDDRVGEASADRQIWTRQTLLEQIARADLAARLLVVSYVQFDRAIERRAAFFESEHRECVSRNVRLRHCGSAPNHPAVDDSRAVRVVSPAGARRHDVAMGVERDRGALPEPAPGDQVGRRNHAVGLDEGLGNLVPLDLKTKSFQECRDDFRGAAAVSGRIVRRNLDDFGEETRLCFGMLAHEVAYRALDWRHRISPVECQASKPSTRIPS